jgi:bifunctional DNA-binding transcriptional regulator/antitoxin component of YhaV-PrlF toxin-antitoxin module
MTLGFYTMNGCRHTMSLMVAIRAKVTRNGQVSLPAELRHRWGVGSVLVIDRGEYAIVRPIPDDTIAALMGAHAGPGPTSDQTRAVERDAEADAQERRGRAQ